MVAEKGKKKRIREAGKLGVMDQAYNSSNEGDEGQEDHSSRLIQAKGQETQSQPIAGHDGECHLSCAQEVSEESCSRPARAKSRHHLKNY